MKNWRYSNISSVLSIARSPPEIYLWPIASASSKNSNAIGIDRRLYG
ncbi:hypothetical protein QUB10_09110 [Microcoleus sp. B5-D4]